MQTPSALQRVRDKIKKYSGYGGTPKPSTDQQLLPYIEQELANVSEQKRRFTPLETALDLLNRGQYVSANIGQEFKDLIERGDPLELWKAIKTGATGEVKGDWEDVLFGDWDPQKVGGRIAKKGLGFLANVLLDPMTYIGFGSTTAARQAGAKYGDDVVRLFVRELGENADEIPRLAKGFSREGLEKAAQKGGDDALQYLQRHGGDDVARVLNTKLKEAMRKGVRTPAKELRQEVQQKALSLADEPIARTTREFGLKGTSQVGGTTDNFIADILTDTNRYAGAGTRAARIFRKELFTSERYPAYVRAWDRAGQMLKDSKVGTLFAKANWALTGPDTLIGKLKAAFGVRNPYQTMLNNLEKSGGPTIEWKMQNEVGKINQILDPLDDETIMAVRDAMAKAQGEMLNLDDLGKLGKNAEKAREAIQQINTVTTKWRDELQSAVNEKIISNFGDIENYLPIRRTTKFFKRVGTVRGAKTTGFMKKRTMTFGEHIDDSTQKLQWIWGIDEDTAREIVKAGGGDIQMDLKTMLTERAIAQAKVQHRIQLVRQFREFGIYRKNITNSKGELVRAITKDGDVKVKELGLRNIDDPALTDYLFDRDVAKILERPVTMASSDDTINFFSRALNRYTSWIKGWLTLSPGFHSRNMMSNNITGFLHHGGEWFNPKRSYAATVGTMYALHGRSKTAEFLKKNLKLSDVKIQRVLDQKINGKTLEELSNFAYKRGVISKATRGFDLDEIQRSLSPGLQGAKKVGEAINPFSLENIGFKASHGIGNIVESIPRMNSFLITVAETGGLDDAVIKAKKLFFDYTDLTTFEKKTLKKVIPFYSWLRKNVALQIESVWKVKDMYSLIPKVENLLTDESVNRTDMPRWMRELGYIPTDINLKKIFGIDENLAFWPNAPYGDLNKLPIEFMMTDAGVPVPVMKSPKETVRDLLISAHPALKSFGEVIFEKDIFYDTPLGDTREAPGLTKLFKKSPKLLQFIDGIMRTFGTDGLDFEIEGDVLKIDAKTAKVLEENIPFLKNLERWMKGPGLLFGEFEKALEEKFGVIDPDNKANEIFSTLSFYSGIKFNILDIEEIRAREAEDILRAAEEERYKDRKNRPGYEQRSQDYWESRAKRRKRLVGF